MGVPKFFRWISERFPKINQPIHCPPNPVTQARYFPTNDDGHNECEVKEATKTNQAIDKIHGQKSTILPEFDRLYLDMNGIIHCCSHNNAENENVASIDRDASIDVSGNEPSIPSKITSDSDSEGGVKITEEEIFRNVCYYVDRVVSDIVQPNELVYMAIDGVAPRAKMNQQRSRRYRSGKEKEIESTFYGAHLLHKQRTEELEKSTEILNVEDKAHGVDVLQLDPYYDDNLSNENTVKFDTHEGAVKSSITDSMDVKEVEPGRFAGTFSTSSDISSSTQFDQDYDTFLNITEQNGEGEVVPKTFHSNCITPGSPFFERCTAHLEHFIKRKLSSDPRWSHLTIIFSGPNVPGEGEHKIMEFIRRQKHRKDYNSNLRHCLFGQDGDLIMLGLATHEPHFALLREEVIFDLARKKAALARSASAIAKKQKKDGDGSCNMQVAASLDSYMNNANFELLHMSILRDYLAYEFETRDVLPESPFDIERTIDDFVFMTFFVGNDFLPHMPAIDIADEAFDLLFYIYKRNRWRWVTEKNRIDSMENVIIEQDFYLTKEGEIMCGKRLERFLLELGQHEDPYYDNKKRSEDTVNKQVRKADERAGRQSSVPPDEILAAKEAWDRANYKEMLESIGTQHATMDGFKPVASSRNIFDHLNTIARKEKKSGGFKPESTTELEDDVLSRMGTLLRNSLSTVEGKSGAISRKNRKGNGGSPASSLDEHVTDIKGRYYYDKFKFSPLDAEKHVALRKAYIQGLVWNLQYYYKGCVSWDWFYPYHYGPMLSDLVNLTQILKEVSFESDTSKPWTPYEQLMSVLPPSSAYLLPKPYQWLMKSSKSPTRDFYPGSFSVDMNGKRWPWEAVVLLPFIDSKRLRATFQNFVKNDILTAEETKRNQLEEARVFTHDKFCSVNIEPLSDNPNFGAIENCQIRELKYSETHWNDIPGQENALFLPKLPSDTFIRMPGFPSLKVAPIQGLVRRRVGINIFGRRSRYRTAVLDIDSEIPVVPSVAVLAEKFIGRSVYFRYPFLQEGFVTAISDVEITIRGMNSQRRWSKAEARAWVIRHDIVRRKYEGGEGVTGSGGWKIPESNTTLSVRPLKEIQTMPDGSRVKVYARLEVEVPLVAALWSPSPPDPRLSNIPARLEKNPYRFGSEPFLSSSLENCIVDGGNQNDLRLPRNADQSISSKEVIKIQPAFNGSLLSKVTPQVEAFDPDKRIKANAKGFGILPPRRKNKKSVSSTYPTRQYSCVSYPFQAQKYINNKSMVNWNKNLCGSHAQKSLRSKVIATVVVAAVTFLSNTGVDAENNTLKLCSSNQVFGKSLDTTFGLNDETESKPFSLDDTNNGIESVSNSKNAPPLKFLHGTTTLSFIFNGGIVAAVDSRASIGNFVGSKTTQKVLPINKHIVGTMAGGAADCSIWIRKLQAEAKLYEIMEKRGITVARASRFLANCLYALKRLDLSVGTMIMGFDVNHGPSIYYVDNTGTRIQGDLFSVGSGSTFALGVLDIERRKDMNEEEAVALGIKAIRHATFRDAFSGGYIAVYVITRDGWKKVFSEDLALSAETNIQNDEVKLD